MAELSAYLDGELTSEGAARVARHLEGCTACSVRYESEKALLIRLRHRRRGPAPPDVARRIRQRLLEEDAASDPPDPGAGGAEH